MTGQPQATRWTARLGGSLFPRYSPWWQHFWLGALAGTALGLVTLAALIAWMATP